MDRGKGGDPGIWGEEPNRRGRGWMCPKWDGTTRHRQRSLEAMVGQRQTKAELERLGSPEELVDNRGTVKKSKFGAEMEPQGRWVEAESGTQRM